MTLALLSKMFFTYTVPVPNMPGKISRQKTKSGTYIHYVLRRQYDPIKKHTVPVRTMIGKLAPDVGQMYPNEKYHKYFECFPETKTIASDHALRPAPNLSSTLRAGAVIAIEAIVKDTKLDQILRASFGESAGLLLELAAYVVIEGANSSATYSDYAYRHPTVFTQGLPVTDETIEACLSSLTEEAVKDFLAQWNEPQDRTARVYVTCDASQGIGVAANRTIVATNDDTINTVHPFDGIGLVMNHTNQVPLLYVPYPRSLTPLSQISFLVNEAKAYGYPHVGVMLAQAAFNERTIRDLDDHELPFVVKLDREGPFFNALVDDYRNTFETKRQARLGHADVYGITVTRKGFPEDKAPRHVHLYWSAKRMVEDRLQLENELDLMTALIERCRGQAVTFDARYSSWFDFEYDSEERLVSAKEKTTVTDQFVERCGYFAIVTSDGCTADEAYTLYFGRDSAATALFAEKAYLSEESQYRDAIHDEASKRVIDFIACIIWQRMFTLLKENKSKGHGQMGEPDVAAAIKALERIELVRNERGQYQLEQDLTKAQEAIVEVLVMTKARLVGKVNGIPK